MGPLAIKRLQCWQGVDMLERFVFFTLPASGSTDPTALAPMDFTDCTARMTIRQDQDPTSLTLLSLTSGSGLTFMADTFTPGPPMPSVNNGVSIAITKAQTFSMNDGVAINDAYYDLLIDKPDGTTMMLMAGPFDVLATVTR